MTDFSVSEFEARLIRAQAAMTVEGFDALFLNTEAEFRFFGKAQRALGSLLYHNRVN